MPIQLAGNIKNGGLFEVAFGITLGELVDDIGGGTFTGRPVRAVQVGGPLGAYFRARCSTRRSIMKPSPRRMA
jgi:formate dehydrogenase iron-sulfur subunit